MIGVILKPEERAVAQEFFELFKTPWEFRQPGRYYEVTLTTGEVPADLATDLLIVYSSGTTLFDEECGLVAQESDAVAYVVGAEGILPVYGGLLRFANLGPGRPVLHSEKDAAAVAFHKDGLPVVRVGYNLFREVKLLLEEGQPAANAGIPALDLHIEVLRNWILDSGVPLVEIAPAPAGFAFLVCLTHDIDFVGIRNHFLDHSMFGFLYRAIVGSAINLARGRISASGLLRNWRAAASLPLIYAGVVKDIWEPFAWYLQTEKALPATYFLIPFPGRCGDNLPGRRAKRRAAAYDIRDLSVSIETLLRSGCEIGVHGIDAWSSAEKGREELAVVKEMTGKPEAGVRMHWLLRDRTTSEKLEEAGFTYDSTVGYNETVGYRAGTGQVFCAPGTQSLLELPMHIQDGALFYPNRLDLSEDKAHALCQRMIRSAEQYGGVLTILWHDRSHAPERLWGDFYLDLLGTLRKSTAWFATGTQAIGWFRARRNVRFERRGSGVEIYSDAGEVQPPLKLRMYDPAAPVSPDRSHRAPSAEIPWTGALPHIVEFCSSSQHEFAQGQH